MTAIPKTEERTWQHPELEDGEFFINYFMPYQVERMLYLSSRRMGEKVYDINGREIPGTNYRPLFVSEADYQRYLERRK